MSGIRTLAVLLVLGVACAMIAVHPHGVEIAAVDPGTSVEVVGDLEPDSAAVEVATPIAPRRLVEIASRSVGSPHRSPAIRPAVPPPRR